MQYALGYQLGRDLVGVESRPQDLLKGVEDGRAGGKAKLSEQEMGAALTALQQKVVGTARQGTGNVPARRRWPTARRTSPRTQRSRA